MKKIIFILLAVFFTVLLSADYVSLGSFDHDNQSHQNPIYALWEYGWSGAIYYQDEIGQAREFNAISYPVNNYPDYYTMENQKIYMAHTGAEHFGYDYYMDPANNDDFTLVYEGDIVWRHGWNTIVLDQVFQYNGNDNLIIYYENHSGAATTEYPTWWATYYYTPFRVSVNYSHTAFPTSQGLPSAFRADIRLNYGEIIYYPEIWDYSLVQSTDLVNWSDVPDNTVIIDPEYDYTYLNTSEMTTSDPLMTDYLNQFYVETYPEGWFDYWAAKGVNENASGWQGVMWEIINGDAPIMYLKYDGQDYMLVDGLLYQIDEGEQNLRYGGDYLLGDYTYTGSVLSEEGYASEPFTIPLTLEAPWVAPPGYDCSSPYVIEALPFMQTGMTTAGFGNDYSVYDACNSYYMNGDDFVFEYIPETDMAIDLALYNTSWYVGLFVVQGCPDDPNSVCVDYAQSTGGNPALNEVYLSLGETYYIIISTWPTPQSTPFDIEITIYEPPVYGSLSGTVTDLDTALPIEGATVVLSDMLTRVPLDKNDLSPEKIEYLQNLPTRDLTVYTDESGNYEFLDVEIGNYETTCSMSFYEPQTVPVTIVEGSNVQDFALDPITDWNLYLALTVDSYPSEASYNLWMPDERGWYWETNQTFTAPNETHEHYLDLPAGIYDVYCWDSYGDGGIAGIVQDENAVELLSWGYNDYSATGIFTFFNGIDLGSICELAFDYGMINDPPQTGSIESNEQVWYSFTIDDAHENVGISLLNSDFDTILELWGDCGDETYLAYNDDWFGRSSIGNGPLSPKEKEQYRVSQSYIEMAYLEAGTYYAKVYGFESDSGTYELEITGDLFIASEVEGYVYDNVTMEPLEGALINPGIAEFETCTDASGYYYIVNLPIGNYNFAVSMPGYAAISEPVTVSEGLNQFDFYLEPVSYIEIGTGTSSTNYVPCYGWYDYGWSGTIYLQEEISEAMTINKIAYHVSNAPQNYTMPDQYIYMAHTDQDVITNNTYQNPAGVRDFQEVFHGEVVWNSGWIEIIFETPFAYNGVDNLMIWWDNFDGDYASGYPSFYYTNQTSRAIYKYADGTFPASSTGTISYYVPNLRIYRAESSILYGDVDGNGLVEAYDTSNLLQYVVELEPDAVPLPWSEDTIAAADVDGNGLVNAYDGALILQYVVEIIDIFPVEELVRHEAPRVLVRVEFVDNELIFTATGELYGFEAELSADFCSVQTKLMHAVNGNKVALASAEAITGEFLRIPVTAGDVTIDMVINNALERLELTSVPSVTALKSNYPNPFNPVTTIAFEVRFTTLKAN